MAVFSGTAEASGYLLHWNVTGGTTYQMVHEALDAGQASNGVFPYVGQEYTPPPAFDNWAVNRGWWAFDTSVIPANASILSGTVIFRGDADSSSTDFDITLVNGTAVDIPCIGSDYGDLFTQTTGGGILNTSSYLTGTNNTIVMNDTGLGWIVKAGTTKLALRSSRDIGSNAPTGKEFVIVYGVDDNYAPTLNINYTVGFIPKVFIF